jgi:hypothetical protein
MKNKKWDSQKLWKVVSDAGTKTDWRRSILSIPKYRQPPQMVAYNVKGRDGVESREGVYATQGSAY